MSDWLLGAQLLSEKLGVTDWLLVTILISD